MNTHPTHTRVGRMGAMAIDSPHRCGCVFFVCIVPYTPWRIDVFFRCIRVFFVRFLECWCVCGRCFFVLSNIVNYIEKNLYSFICKLRLRKRQPNPGRKST